MNAAHAIAKDSGQTGFLNAESKEQSDQQKQTGNLDAPDLICSGHLTSFENGVPILLYDFDHRAPRGVWKGAMTVRHGANNHIETTQPVHIVGFSNQDPADARKMSEKLQEVLQRFKVARDLLRSACLAPRLRQHLSICYRVPVLREASLPDAGSPF
jgi:hypothetical protein